MPLPKLKWEDTDSSNVGRVAYHMDTKTLIVEFRNGGLYSYSDVDEPTYWNMMGSESVGRYLNAVIKGLHTYEKFVSEADLLHSLQR